MKAEDLKPNKILTGPIFPEPVQIIVCYPMGDGVKLVAKGLNTSRVYEPVLTAENIAKAKAKGPGGFTLEYDAARKIAQGLGAILENLGSLVEISGETARLLPVGERAQHLFGKDDATLAGQNLKRKKRDAQMDMFKVLGDADAEGGTTFGLPAGQAGETVPDRIHQSMILFAAGRSEALKRFLVEDGAGRDPHFWRLQRGQTITWFVFPVGIMAGPKVQMRYAAQS